MLRRAVTYDAHWCDKTMRVLMEAQLSAFEKITASASGIALFDDGCCMDTVQQLWEHSYYRSEHNQSALVTVDTVRSLVLAQLDAELDYISVDEHILLERMLLFSGEAEITETDEISASEALVKRLWCVVYPVGDRLFIRLPDALHTPVVNRMQTQAHTEARVKLFGFDATIHGLLYLLGFLHVSQPLSHFLTEVSESDSEDMHALGLRYLTAGFDYVLDVNGDVILIHPGLADPYSMLDKLSQLGHFTFEVSDEMMLGGMNGLLREEESLFLALCHAFEGKLRSEYTEEEAARDLRLLAKQGVSFQEMSEVLGALLTTLPDERMLTLIKRLCSETPAWAGLCASVKH